MYLRTIDIHPQKLCNLCYVTVKNAHASKMDVNLFKQKHPNMKEQVDSISRMWQTHKRKNCIVYNTFTNQMHPGRRKSLCKRGRPVTEKCCDERLSTEGNLFATIFHDTHEKINFSEVEVCNLNESHLNTFICHNCKSLLSVVSIKTACSHYFCSACMPDSFKNEKNTTIKCLFLACIRDIDLNDVKAVDDRFKQQILNLDVKCKQMWSSWACLHISSTYL